MIQKTVEILQVQHIDKVIEVPQAQLIDEVLEVPEIMQIIQEVEDAHKICQSKPKRSSRSSAYTGSWTQLRALHECETSVRRSAKMQKDPNVVKRQVAKTRLAGKSRERQPTERRREC